MPVASLTADVVMRPVVPLLKLTVPPMLRAVRGPSASVLPLEALIVDPPALTVRPFMVCVLVATVGA